MCARAHVCTCVRGSVWLDLKYMLQEKYLNNEVGRKVTAWVGIRGDPDTGPAVGAGRLRLRHMVLLCL